MEKKEFMEKLLSGGVTSVAIISYPDYNGGRECGVTFNTTLEDIKLDDFEYIEYFGDATEVVRDRFKVFTDHFEPRYESPIDIDHELWQLVYRGLRNTGRLFV